MMRVLFITRNLSPAVGAMETYSIELTGELRRMRRLRVRRLPGRADERTPSMLSLAHRTVLSVLAIGAGRRVDVIDVGDLVVWPLAVAGRLCQPAVSAVVTTHGLSVVHGSRKGIPQTMYRVYLVALRARRCAKRARMSAAVSRCRAGRCHAIGFPDIGVLPHTVFAPAWDAGEAGRWEPHMSDVDGAALGGRRR